MENFIVDDPRLLNLYEYGYSNPIYNIDPNEPSAAAVTMMLPLLLNPATLSAVCTILAIIVLVVALVMLAFTIIEYAKKKSKTKPKVKEDGDAPEHQKRGSTTPSNKNRHQKGQTAKDRQKHGGEKGDNRRTPNPNPKKPHKSKR